MDFEDSLELKQSSTLNVTSGGNVTTDLTLDAAQDLSTASVSGTVYDTSISGSILGGATVTVFDSSGNIVDSTTSSLLGIYLISGLTSGTTYTIIASKDGYTTSDSQSFTANILIPSVINLVITPNDNENLNTVYGIVTDTSDVAIESANVSLKNSSTGETFSTTASIADGEYVIYNIPTGTYTLTANKSGYYSTIQEGIELTTSQKSAQNISLEADSSSSNGNISGIITDTNSDPVENAFVGLYTIDSSETPETLIDYTFTNSDGRYIFSNVVPDSYVIKAKLSVSA